MDWAEKLREALEEFAIPSTEDLFNHLEEIPEGHFYTCDQGFVEISRTIH